MTFENFCRLLSELLNKCEKILLQRERERARKRERERARRYEFPRIRHGVRAIEPTNRQIFIAGGHCLILNNL